MHISVNHCFTDRVGHSALLGRDSEDERRAEPPYTVDPGGAWPHRLTSAEMGRVTVRLAPRGEVSLSCLSPCGNPA